ncbi:hypothetical protein [Streptomyces albogriseolus]|uniref:hypothetical protein n=1 Tax=Streptomyces albogriseolus TaxID=1887 RepID=UPI00167C39CC|nr:hypothetical protein [Streptomyces viridodiastaticus]GHG12753.1 hypothetical protein GCM10018777_27290 [Streptomyces viridodiastaticus]
MGYWGYFVVGRAERPLAGLDALAGAGGDLTLRCEAPDGWQVWELPGRAGELGSMNELAAETGAPALFGYVMDGACVAVEAASPESGVWTACLGRDAMAGYLDGRQEGLTVEDYFLERADAAERAVFWAEEAGRTVAPEDVLEVLTADPGPMAENLFFRLLDRLRVVPE